MQVQTRIWGLQEVNWDLRRFTGQILNSLSRAMTPSARRLCKCCTSATCSASTSRPRIRYLRFFGAVGEHSLRRVRHLELRAWTTYYGHHTAGEGEQQWQFFRPAAPDVAAWAALLHRLADLRCTFMVPKWGYHAGLPVCVGQPEKVLEFLWENVDENTEVTTDDNYSMSLCEAVDKCFLKEFRRVRTPQDDSYYYYRKRFDPENLEEPIGSQG
ncbi:hypothetical protein AAE478_002069 [Parahypoxylon ruwenzoriense]